MMMMMMMVRAAEAAQVGRRVSIVVQDRSRPVVSATDDDDDVVVIWPSRAGDHPRVGRVETARDRGGADAVSTYRRRLAVLVRVGFARGTGGQLGVGKGPGHALGRLHGVGVRSVIGIGEGPGQALGRCLGVGILPLRLAVDADRRGRAARHASAQRGRRRRRRRHRRRRQCATRRRPRLREDGVDAVGADGLGRNATFSLQARDEGGLRCIVTRQRRRQGQVVHAAVDAARARQRWVRKIGRLAVGRGGCLCRWRHRHRHLNGVKGLVDERQARRRLFRRSRAQWTIERRRGVG